MLTKREMEVLRSDKVQIQQPGSQIGTKESFLVFMSLTKGELLALRNALENNPTVVGEDVRDYVLNALERAEIKFF